MSGNPKVIDRPLDAPGLFEVVCHQFWLCFDHFREVCCESIRDSAVQLPAHDARQTRIGSILDERVLENICGIRRFTPAQDQINGTKLRKGG